MIDRPDRTVPRFPPEREPVAAAAIAAKLDELGAGAADLGICGGACGGDLLFAEAALARGLCLEVRIPFPEPEFLANSVAFAGEEWVRRFQAVKAHAHARLFVMPRELGPMPEGEDPYLRENQWLLDSARRWGAGRLEFICLWDGRGGDRPGGTADMRRQVSLLGSPVHWLDTNRLWRTA
jgi:hypothetical protein